MYHFTVVIYYNRNMTKTAIYTRVSKSDGSQDPENQLRELRAFCKKQSWEIVEVYTDYASGKRSDRLAHRRLMLDASKGKFDVVLFWAIDRFSREGIEATLAYIRVLASYKVGIRSYSEPYFDSAGELKELMISMFASFAKLERAKISERTLAGLAKARAKGNIGGRPKAEDDPATLKAFRKLSASGLSVRKIASEMGVSPTTVQKLSKIAA
jgi:DNA invertase Pin-like site-specific DNA recombinase